MAVMCSGVWETRYIRASARKYLIVAATRRFHDDPSEAPRPGEPLSPRPLKGKDMGRRESPRTRV